MKAQQLKNSILQLAVQGKLVPQNPSDEPASVLLERIRAEKQRLIKEGKIKKEKPLPPIAEDEIPFDIPNSWEWVRLSCVVNEISTGPFGSMLHKSDYVVSGLPLVNPQNIVDGAIQANDKTTVSKATAERLKSYILNTNDIVIARRGEMGRCAVVDQAQSGWLCGTGCFILRTNLNIFCPYLTMLIRSRYAVDFLTGNSIGTTMSNLNHGILNQFLVPVPPLAEQYRIVERIEQLLPHIADYDHAEQKLTTLNTAFPGQLKKSILQAAVQGKLVEQDPNDEPASVLLERIRAEKERLIKEGKIKKEKPLPPISEDEIPFDVPEGWEWVRLGNIGQTNIGLTYNPSDVTTERGIAVLRSNNIRNGKISYDNLIHVDIKVSEKLMVQQGDILVCARNGSRALVGKSAIIEENGMSFGAFMAIFRSICNPYVQLFINSSLFRGQLEGANTTTINQVTQEMLKQSLCPIPPLEEQKRIVAKYEELLQLIERWR